ncbi:MAG: hypothetical protein ISP88_05785 [Pseudomonadales bacterium]|jgi:hypothetical protein|nr:hypothetical protein [Pseudomonadales bacterium]MBL6816198.1 hypothetical protein [Pseudomonadales bacterium]
MFFKPCMLTETFAARMAKSFLDAGSASLGRKYDQIDDIDYPISNVAMDKIEYLVQTHI